MISRYSAIKLLEIYEQAGSDYLINQLKKIIETPTKHWECSIDFGAMINAPLWSMKKNEKNWLAIIRSEPSEMYGLARFFIQKTNSVNHTYMTTYLAKGQYLEFGIERSEKSGRELETIYAKVLLINQNKIILDILSFDEITEKKILMRFPKPRSRICPRVKKEENLKFHT